MLQANAKIKHLLRSPLSPGTFPIEAVEILKKLEQLIPETEFRLVGGCLRDLLLDKVPKDYDIVTDASPEQLESIGLERIGRFPVYLYRHDTLGQLEIACCRSECKIKPGHSGFEVIPHTSFYEDAIRRDFTVNAMSWHHCNGGTLYTLTSAINDLHNHYLRPCSSAYDEDPIRLLRAVRFSNSLSKGTTWSIMSKSMLHMYDTYEPQSKEIDYETMKVELLYNEPADRLRNEFEYGIKTSNKAKNLYSFVTTFLALLNDCAICSRSSIEMQHVLTFFSSINDLPDDELVSLIYLTLTLTGELEAVRRFSDAFQLGTKKELMSFNNFYIKCKSLNVPLVDKVYEYISRFTRGSIPIEVYNKAMCLWRYHNEIILPGNLDPHLLDVCRLAVQDLKFDATMDRSHIEKQKKDIIMEILKFYESESKFSLS